MYPQEAQTVQKEIVALSGPFERWRIVRSRRFENASAVRFTIEQSTSLCVARSKALNASFVGPLSKAGIRPWCHATGSWLDQLVYEKTTHKAAVWDHLKQRGQPEIASRDR